MPRTVADEPPYAVAREAGSDGLRGTDDPVLGCCNLCAPYERRVSASCHETRLSSFLRARGGSCTDRDHLLIS
jgi:hypothetical protein